MTITRSDTRDAGEKDVETASIETSVVMVDTKATTEAKKEHEAKKSALGTLNTFDGGAELHGCGISSLQTKISIQLSRPGG
jgi:hypothetical protein